MYVKLLKVNVIIYSRLKQLLLFYLTLHQPLLLHQPLVLLTRLCQIPILAVICTQLSMICHLGKITSKSNSELLSPSHVTVHSLQDLYDNIPDIFERNLGLIKQIVHALYHSFVFVGSVILHLHFL